MVGESLGSDRLNVGKVLGLTIFTILLIWLNWVTANATLAAQNAASFYFSLGVGALVIVILDLIIVKKAGIKLRGADVPDTITYEVESPIFGEFPRWIKILIIGGSFAMGGMLFAFLGGVGVLGVVQAPSFQLVELGAAGEAILSGIAGIVEDMLFWGVIAGITFSLFKVSTKSSIISMVASFGITPVIFMLYHIGRYSESLVALNTVLVFGFIAMGMVLATGTLIPAHALHFSNNFAIVFFSMTTIDVGFFFWIYMFLVATLTGTALFKWGSGGTR